MFLSWLSKRTSYKTYLKGAKWQKFRAKNLDDRCRICKRKEYLQLHHLTYKKGLENPGSVITVCKWCHNSIHRKAKEQHISIKEATERALKSSWF